MFVGFHLFRRLVKGFVQPLLKVNLHKQQLYVSDKHHQEQLRAKADKAIEQGLTLFITEWGVGEADGNGKFDCERNKTWMNWMEDNKLSWANWNITDKEETTALLKPGTLANGGWSRGQLYFLARRREIKCCSCISRDSCRTNKLVHLPF